MISVNDYLSSPPVRKDYGIGIVGCGGIVRHAHLPAYRKFGYRVAGCADIDPTAVKAVQSAFGVPFGTTDVEALCRRTDVDVIDLAVHASVRREVLDRVSRFGKPVLTQKPFAMNWDDATAMVTMCRERGVKLMVNQQARWAPAHRALRVLIDRGSLGHVYSITHVSRGFQDDPGSWFVKLQDFNLVDHGIHYIDLIRCFAGRSPERVYASAVMVPGQAAVSPMCHTLTMDFHPDAHLTAVSHFNNIVQSPRLHDYTWHIDGTEGSAMARDNELTVGLKSEPLVKHTHAIQGSWFPDAFGGSMGELFSAIAEERDPETSGEDNLKSIAIAYAAVESVRTGRVISPATWESDLTGQP